MTLQTDTLSDRDRWGQTRLIFDNFQVSNSLLGNKEGQVLFLPSLLHKKMPLLAASKHDARKICAVKPGG
ncbi:hypothetical protein MNBD_BACTEROID06-1513 [hydrothermal vent metagenome]|uniref:Uncharacterized protein n=1 Tax=hydrothermal vent metagenome TaxID=652676 RepID=A0A3B0UUT7_9ZZZZ